MKRVPILLTMISVLALLSGCGKVETTSESETASKEEAVSASEETSSDETEASEELPFGAYVTLEDVPDTCVSLLIVGEGGNAYIPDDTYQCICYVPADTPLTTEQKEKISSLKCLEDLDYKSMFASDYNEVKGLTNLKTLGCQSLVDCTDLSALSTLTNLEGFWTFDSGADISFLSGMTSLKSLELYDAENISDLSAIGNLTNLDTLIIGRCNSITDFTPILNCTKLTYLDIYGIQSASLPDLSALTQLETFRTYWNPNLENLSGLAGCCSITDVYITECPVLSDITGLSNCTSMTKLDISDCNAITSLNGIENMSVLSTVEAESCTNLTDISALQSITTIKNLSLEETGVSDITVLSGVDALITLSLKDCYYVSDISPLLELENLRTIYLQDTKVPDLQIEKLKEKKINYYD